MQLITFSKNGRIGYGAVKGDAIVDLGARLGRDAPSLADLITHELADKARDIVSRENGDMALASVVAEKPVTAPGKILCIGVNYLDRNAEYKDGSEQPKKPSVFLRVPGSFA